MYWPTLFRKLTQEAAWLWDLGQIPAGVQVHLLEESVPHKCNALLPHAYNKETGEIISTISTNPKVL
jgi:hypothetical protein